MMSGQRVFEAVYEKLMRRDLGRMRSAVYISRVASRDSDLLIILSSTSRSPHDRSIREERMMNYDDENETSGGYGQRQPLCHLLQHSEMNNDLRPYSKAAPTPCCYIGDNDPDDLMDEEGGGGGLPRMSDNDREIIERGFAPMIDNMSKTKLLDGPSPCKGGARSVSGNIDEGIGSELTSTYAGLSPPLITPQTSVEPNKSSPDYAGSNAAVLRSVLENIAEHSDLVDGASGPEPVANGIGGGVHRQSSEEEEQQQQQHRKRKSEPPTVDSTNPSPESTSPIMSTYDWPMTTTEKLMSKYAYKNELGQFTKRMDNVFPLFGSGQRETILQGLRAIRQVIEEAWRVPENNGEIVGGICGHLQKSGNLDFIISLFLNGQFELRLEAGEALDAYLSEETCAYLIQSGNLKSILDTIVNECDGKDTDTIRLCLSLLEALFRHGAETCKAVVDLDGLEFILNVCKNHMEIDIRVHAAVALANLSIFGGAEIRETMVRKQVPAWLFVLLTNDDVRVKYYACLCLCMMASQKELERDVQNSGSLNLVGNFLRTCRPESLAKTDSKYRSGRSSEWLSAFSPLLMSTVPEVLALATFQFAMEAYLRKGSAKIDVFEELRLIPRIQEIASVPGYDLASKFAAKILSMIGEHVPYKLSQTAPLWTIKDVQYWVRKTGFVEYVENFGKHRVDGDLLLQTTEEHLKNEIGMKSAYERMRFVRELNSLKRSCDYSAVDRTRLDAWLMRLDPEFSIYTYQMLQNGVDRSALIHLDDEMVRDVCGIQNSVHRLKLNYAIKEVKHVEELDLALLRKQVDIFICYRRSTGSQLASLLKVHLQLRGFKVFIDVDRLYAGQFDKSLLMNIRAAKHFILVLSSRSLDPCVGDDECKDWVHLEIQTALNANANIVPVQEKGFEWPATAALPADIQQIAGYNAIQWVHEYQEACVDKLNRFLNGQASALEPQISAASCVSSPSVG